MNPEKKFGRTEVALIHVFEPAELEFSDGHATPSTLGRTEVVLQVLPEEVLEMEPVRSPVLQLTVWFRPTASAGEVAADLFRLYAAVNEFDLSHGGAGLVPDGVTPDGVAVRMTFRSAGAAEAADRLAMLAGEINTAAHPTGPSVERWEVSVLVV